MKSYKLISLIIGGFMLAFASCEPIEDRATLENSFDPNDIELEVIQSTTGGNNLSIRMNTPGVTGYWDYIIDTKKSDRVEVIFPIPGLNTFTFYVTTPYMTFGSPDSVEYISKTIDVQIDVLDHELPQPYYDLVGANLEGKTWVFDGTGGDGGLWWYMSDPGNWAGLWWNAGGECCPPSDVDGKMIFDLDAGANYTYYADAAGTGVTGSSWAFNSDFTKFFIKGDANILGSEEGGANNREFQLIELTADKMVLFIPDAPWGSGWTWIFIPQP
ncbi:MAG: hypothetical protein DRJ10_03085 [Bacteroidetes bacterium]|nr:MAG: hypothetical protein DRJ10_03085 [Bacteroidota bacterium]